MQLTPIEAQRLAGALLRGDTDAEADLPARVPQAFGRYRVTRLIGLGGMGEVYEAQQESPERRVAIKTIRPELLSPDLARRFDLEARVLGRLQHPGIAQIFEAGRADTGGGTTPYFAMEYVEGRPLTRFARESELSIRDRLGLFLKVCEAVEHAHQRGVIHRDLKPANILIDGAGQPRILDFGVARATDADVRATTIHTEVGKLVGTLQYMSPEQVAGDADGLDTRSDVYSLGVVLYELLAGKLPYEVGRGPIAAAARTIAEAEPSPLSSADRVFRGDLDTIVGKALAKEPERRYQSVSALAADVRRFLADEPIEARPASAMYQVRKFARRNRTAVGLALAMAMILFIASLVATGLALSERRARKQVEGLEALASERLVRSQKQTALANASLSFMENIFTGITPQEAKGRQLSANELVDRAAATVRSRKYEDDELRGAVMFAVGKTYKRLARNDEAMTYLIEARNARESAYGPDHPATLDVRADIAGVLHQMGRYDKARAEMEEVLAVRTRLLGPSDPATLRSQRTLGAMLLETHHPDVAAPYLESYLASQDQAELDTSLEGLSALHNMAGLRVEQHRAGDAEPLARRALEGRRRTLGDLHPDTLESATLLTMIQMMLGRHEDAAAGMRRLIDDYRTVYGPRHQKTVDQMFNLCGVLYEAQRLDDAQTLAEEILEIRKETLGPTHRDTIGARVMLARIAHERKDTARAETILRDALSLPTDSADREIRPLLQRLLGEILTDAGRFEDAEQLLLESFASIRAMSKPTGPRFRQAVGSLVDLYEKWGKPEKAAEYRSMAPAGVEERPRVPAATGSSGR